ncbi:MAG: hypothetical protein Q9170_002020 [Blastenia crenularia]
MEKPESSKEAEVRQVRCTGIKKKPEYLKDIKYDPMSSSILEQYDDHPRMTFKRDGWWHKGLEPKKDGKIAEREGQVRILLEEGRGRNHDLEKHMEKELEMVEGREWGRKSVRFSEPVNSREHDGLDQWERNRTQVRRRDGGSDWKVEKELEIDSVPENEEGLEMGRQGFGMRQERRDVLVSIALNVHIFLISMPESSYRLLVFADRKAFQLEKFREVLKEELVKAGDEAARILEERRPRRRTGKHLWETRKQRKEHNEGDKTRRRVKRKEGNEAVRNAGMF